jgi:hypothetical protein
MLHRLFAAAAWIAATRAAALPSPATIAPEIVDPLAVSVGATDDKACQAYFHTRTGQIHYPIVLSLKGTGVYTTGGRGDVELALRALYASGRITVLTIDKPGIDSSAARPLVNDALYNRYVQEDLVRCATNALTYAADATKAPGAVFVSGHSEGAQVAVKILDRLTADAGPRAAWVKALFLSGLPLGDWRRMIAGQLNGGDRRTFFTAFEQRDDAVLRSFGNLSTAYLTQAFAGEPLDKTLARHAGRGVKAEFNVYQGLADRNTPAAAVRVLERANLQGPALNLKVHYYPTDHGLSRAAVMDIARDVGAWIASVLP